MTRIDVLLVTALKEEYDAAREVAQRKSHVGIGVPEWERHDDGITTPYLYGKYIGMDGRNISVALARPTRMGSNSMMPVMATLIERLKPRCLAMCGVCAGNPGELALGDVIIAEMAYAFEEGKVTRDGFVGDHRQFPMRDDWLRAAQELLPDGLPSYGPASFEESRLWILERLYAGDDPLNHLARARYFPEGTWGDHIRSLERDGLVRREGMKLILNDIGKEEIEQRFLYSPEIPERLPFRIKVGPMASGNVVVKDGLKWDQLKSFGVRTVLGLEMEAAALANAAHRLKVPSWLVVKGVMDHADPRKDDRYKPFAARASAEVLFRFLQDHLWSLTSLNMTKTNETATMDGVPKYIIPSVEPEFLISANGSSSVKMISPADARKEDGSKKKEFFL